jgi:hypothetical protein
VPNRIALRAFAHSDLPALRHPCLRWSDTPAPGTWATLPLPRVMRTRGVRTRGSSEIRLRRRIYTLSVFNILLSDSTAALPLGSGERVGVRMRSVADLRQRRNSCRPRAGLGSSPR